MNRLLLNKASTKKMVAIFMGLSIMFLTTHHANAQKNKGKISKNYYNSAWVVYDSVVSHINKGNLQLAEHELSRIIDGFDKERFVECSDEHSVRLLKYKSHVVLANIAYAEKRKDDLYKELNFFEKADTAKSEWKRARHAATHYRHKYYELSKGKFGKIAGDWVSLWKNAQGEPMVWIHVWDVKNTLMAELKDCAMKSILNSKYNTTDKIVVNNIDNVFEINFGDSKLIPGLQILPDVLISTVDDTHQMLSESIARQSIAKSGTPYTSKALTQQLEADAVTLLIEILIAQLSVSKETVTVESFIMEQVSSEFYMAKIRLKTVTAYSNGKYKEKFSWAEIPVIHLYPKEQLDFSKAKFDRSIDKAISLVCDELWWEGSEDSDNESIGIADDIEYSRNGIHNVENTSFNYSFHFLGKNINYATLYKSSSTYFSGLAQATNLWGVKENPVNPFDNKSEVNTNIIPLRGVFKTVLSPTECITFTGDWNYKNKCGNGLMTYTNLDSPELSFTYEGTIKKGYPHGLGIWQGHDFRYVGWFYYGKRIGYGTLSYNNGITEQGFVTKEGNIVSDTLVTEEMKKTFNDKVKKISKHKYQILED